MYMYNSMTRKVAKSDQIIKTRKRLHSALLILNSQIWHALKIKLHVYMFAVILNLFQSIVIYADMHINI